MSKTHFYLVFGPQEGAVDGKLQEVLPNLGSFGNLLVREAYGVFVNELQTAQNEREKTIYHIEVPKTLKDFIGLDNVHQTHQAIRNFMHCLNQALQLLMVLQSERISLDSLLAPPSIRSPEKNVTILSLCSGTLAGHAFATSTRSSQLLFRMTESLRLAFWLGLRVTQAAECCKVSQQEDQMYYESIHEHWCMSVSGCSLQQLQVLLYQFALHKTNKSQDTGSIVPWITVVTSNTKFSIGGPPEELAAFQNFVISQQHFLTGSSIKMREIQISTPYHSMNLLKEAANSVEEDMKRRKIQITSLEDIVHPCYESIEGKLMPYRSNCNSLSQCVISSILLHAARWDLLMENLDIDTAHLLQEQQENDEQKIFIVNAGPKTWYANDVRQVLQNMMTRGGTANTNVKLLAAAQSIRSSSLYESDLEQDNGELGRGDYTPLWKASPVAITTVFISDADENTWIEAAANHICKQAPTTYFDDPEYYNGMGCFLSHESSAFGQVSELLRKLVTKCDWPEPMLVGKSPENDIMQSLLHACDALRSRLCKFAIAGGSEFVFGNKRRVALFTLERQNDSQRSGSLIEGIILESVTVTGDLDHQRVLANLASSFDVKIDQTSVLSPKTLQSKALEKMLETPINESRHVILSASISDSNKSIITILFQTVEAGVDQRKPKQSHFFGLTGETLQEIDDRRARLLQFCSNKDLEEDEDTFLDNVSYATFTRSHTEPAYRLSIAAGSKSELLQTLANISVQKAKRSSNLPKRRIGFVFSGQGCQYPSMARGLYESCKVFREKFEECDHLARVQGFPGFISILFDKRMQDIHTRGIKEQASQLAIFAIEVSLASILITWGVNPTCCSGHSLGHYAACYVTGVLNLSDAIYLVGSRSSLFRRLCAPNTSQMMAISGCSEEKVLQILAETKSQATIACFNSPTDMIISGLRTDLTDLVKHMKQIGVKVKLLEVPFGFHSSYVVPAVDGMLRAAQNVTVHAPQLAITSNVYGRVIQAGQHGIFDSSYFASHLRLPVRFASAAKQATDELGITDWIEIGPHPICLPMLKSTLANNGGSRHVNVNLLPTMRRNSNDWCTLITTLVALWGEGYDVAWQSCLRSQGKKFGRCSDLTFPLDEQRRAHRRARFGSRKSTWDTNFCSGHISQAQSENEEETDQKLILKPWLHKQLLPSSTFLSFSTPLSYFQHLVEAHRVVDLPTFSASLHSELALQALYSSEGIDVWNPSYKGNQYAIEIEDLIFRAPLVLEEGGRKSFDYENFQLNVVLNCTQTPSLFAISGIKNLCQERRQEYASGRVAFHDINKIRSLIVSDEGATRALRRCSELDRQRRTEGSLLSTFALPLIYKYLSYHSIKYKPCYQSICSFTLSENDGFGIVRVPEDKSLEICNGTILHPALQDAMLHAGSFFVNQQNWLNDEDTATNAFYLGAKVGQMLFFNVGVLNAKRTYKVYVTSEQPPTYPNEIVTNTYLLDEDGVQVLGWALGVVFKKMQPKRLVSIMTRASLPRGSLLGSKGKEGDDEAYSELYDLITQQTIAEECTYDVHHKENEEYDDQDNPDDFLLRLFPGLRGADLSFVSHLTEDNTSSTPSSSSDDESSSQRLSKRSSAATIGDTADALPILQKLTPTFGGVQYGVDSPIRETT